MSTTWLRWPLAGCLLVSFAAVSPAEETPRWIWCDGQRTAGKTATFRKSFALQRRPTVARLRVVGESARLAVDCNGDRIAELDAHDPPRHLDIADRLNAGEQTLTVQATSCAGPAAFFLQLELVLPDDSRRSIVSDSSWKVEREIAAPSGPSLEFGRVDERLLIPRSKMPSISLTDDYEQWRQALGTDEGADPASFLVTPGFEIQLIRSAQADEDSWVSLAFDPRGRVVIAKEEHGLLRMTLSSDGTRVERVELINQSLQECRGLLFAFGDLFANANNSKGLYRLPANENDGFDEPQLLLETAGGVGHGRNDMALGPDQNIYVIHGDSVALPDALDWTSPYREARRGKPTSEGHLLRISPRDGEVELVAAGLRNPFGIDFNREGDVFTYDADAEYDMGAAWYRPTRVSHLVTGGDYGWRGVTRSWPPYYPDHPDNALPNQDIGKGSPTAVKFGYRSNFPSRYREALFILDWAYGRILAIHLQPRGSSYLMSGETFLKGRPLNVTDLDFAPDGSMYFVTGGRGTRSALYRVRYVGAAPPTEPPATPQQLAREAFASGSRKARRQLESYLHREFSDSIPEEVWQALGDADPRIRLAARNVLERQPIEAWREAALTESDRTTALAALLALARSPDEDVRPRIVRRLNELNWPAGSRTDRVTALYCYWLCLNELADFDESLVAATIERLSSQYTDREYEANQWLSQILLRLNPSEAVPKTMALLTTATEQAEIMHYLFVLRDVEQGWTAELREAYFAALNQSRHFLGGDGMPDFLARIRREAIDTLSEAERGSLGALLAGSPMDSNDPPPPRAFVRRWALQDLADSLSDVGDARRDLRRGEALFAAAACSRCHRLSGRGHFFGPDLTFASSRFGRRDLLEAILDPSKVIPEKYRSLRIVTRDGRVHVGQPVSGGDYRSSFLRLLVDPLETSKVVEIHKADIDHQTEAEVSWMPTGLLDTLERDEILDLLAYIEAQGRTE